MTFSRQLQFWGEKISLETTLPLSNENCPSILDDPLSAVDAHVGKHIFDSVINRINGALNNKTTIWVTNQTSYLSQVDQVIFLKDGKVNECGSFLSLMENKGWIERNSYI